VTAPALSAAHDAATVRRTALAAFVVALVHVVFGAIVRITGSGMGCADRWPRCADPRTGQEYWFPPLDLPILVIEWAHRLLASVLIVAVLATLAMAWRRRATLGGPGGPLRSAGLALGLVLFAAGFGAVTVFTVNPPWATVVHKLIAASLLAALAATVVRAGGFGGAEATPGSGTPKAVRGATVAAVLALVVVTMGAFTAKIPDAAVACAGFPLCGEGSLGGGPQHVQLTHRVLAYLLVLHLIGLPFAFRKRGEATPVRRLAVLAAVFGVLQVVWAGWMVTGGFPAMVRSLHQGTGVAIWVVTFTMAYVARRASAQRTAMSVENARSPLGAHRSSLLEGAR
jgi:heme A synthase